MNDAPVEPVTFHRLGHAYRPGQWVFRDLSGFLARGKIAAVLGTNGCSKTTLLKQLLRVLPPTEGKVNVLGKTAFVPQLFQVAFDYTVRDMVLMGRASRVGLLSQPSARDEQSALVALDRFGLASLASRPFHELSGGQRQMVIFARALVAEAEILLLDEPMSSLDLQNQSVILHAIHALSRESGLTVLFTTHQPHHALAIADHALLMFPGGGHFGPVASALTDENLLALYGVEMKRVRFASGSRQVETIVPLYPQINPHDENNQAIE